MPIDSNTIDSYKAHLMRTFIELWMKICPDHSVSIRDGELGKSALYIQFPESFATRIRFNSPEIQEINKTTTYRDEYGSTSADRERILERQIEVDELRAAAKRDHVERLDRKNGYLSVKDMNKVIKDIEDDHDDDTYIPA